MIWYYIISFIDGFFSAILGILHVPKVETLPFGVDETLVTGFGYVHKLMEQFPPLSVIMTAFMWYVGIKLILLILKNIPILRLDAKA